MVVIRLSRGGSKKRPFYNIVVADSRNRRDGRFIERLGFYNPVGNPDIENLRINHERVDYWVSVGAQVSDAVARLVKDSKSGNKEQSVDSKNEESKKAKVEEPKKENTPKVEEPKAEEKSASDEESKTEE
ncbi:30S ribosomal protein S16 [Taylorella equigenitalis]|uniref:Small ribosomal subunit protein bS16 n=1 Tax=Taylorella equigenitalis (strain MCE9) TaxID=937774 RepID=A0A654KI93_TAYEM|nr:SSU ribosomal protein S16p [Taylorella equigenitalis MCE9]ASY40652.1 30S ribosomal protein S16 [Taylorella equigenitalis]WDU46952.1 30S ribosomal protein S16 [Taylorella equigenitalis]WDU48431.1 30S ribosomal protein S16 [Taylorella equigenitalis]WDU56909.1 30S ribosomal protein S16 [Taylorella equigenitalis]